MLEGPGVESEGREPTCVQGWGSVMGTHPGTMGLPPLAPPASFGKAPGTAAKLYSKVSVSLKWSPTSRGPRVAPSKGCAHRIGHEEVQPGLLAISFPFFSFVAQS